MKKTSKFISVIISLIIILEAVFIQTVAADTSETYLAIGFENVATNGLHDLIKVDGCPNARIVEDSSGNKSLYVGTTSVDNRIEILPEEIIQAEVYFVQLDINSQATYTEGIFSLRKADSGDVSLLQFKETGEIYTLDNKYAGGIVKNTYTNIGIKIDNSNQSFSVYVNGKCTISNWELPGGIASISGFSVETYRTDVPESCVNLDNIKIYSGDSYISGRVTETRLNETLEFIPVSTDESAAKVVHLKRNFDSKDDIGMNMISKTNTIEWRSEENGNGYLAMAGKTKDDMYCEVNVATPNKNIVLEMDVRYDDSLINSTLFMLRDTMTNTSMVQFTDVYTNGANITASGSGKALTTKKWTNVAMVLNLRKGKYDVYIDNKKSVEGGSLPSTFKRLSVWRIYCGTGINGGEIFLDNIRIYDGEEPRDVDNEAVSEKSIFSDSEAIEFLTGKRALQPYSNKMWVNNRKISTDLPCITLEKDTLISIDTFKKLFQKEISVSGNKIIADGAVMEFDKNEITIGDSVYVMDEAPRLVNCSVMIPVLGYAKYAMNGKGLYNDGHGLYLISREEYSDNDTRVKEANMYLFSNRYSANELKEKFLSNTDNGTKHPRIWADADDFAKLRENVKTDPYLKDWYAQVVQRATTYMNAEVSEYIITGSKLLDVTTVAFERVLSLGLCYQITNDEKYAERVYKEISALCSFPDWHPDHSLDTGMAALAVGIGYDWTYDYLKANNKLDEIEAGAERCGFTPAHQAYVGTASYSNVWWTDTDTNWGFIVNAGYATLAAAMAETNPDYYMEIIRNAYQSAESPLYKVAPDGAWHEGPHYWSYGGGPLIYLLDTYKCMFGEDWALNFMGMKKFAEYSLYFTDPNGDSNNFHDADSAVSRVMDPLCLYIGKENNDKAFSKLMAETFKQFGVNAPVEAILYYDTEATNYETETTYPLDSYFRETEFLSMREKWNDKNASWMSAHGGFTNGSHNHIDEGAFVYNIGGVRWAIDLGLDWMTYSMSEAEIQSHTGGYDHRWFYRKKGEGHNIVVINPDKELEMDTTQFAKIEPVKSGYTKAFTSVDLSNHYAKNVNSYKRGYMLSDYRRSFTVRDEIELKDNSELYWFMHTKGSIVIVDNNTALIMQDGKTLKMQFVTNASGSNLSVMNAVKLPTSPQFDDTANEGVTKIAYKLNGSGNINIEVKMSLLQEAGSKTAPANIPISQWTIEDDDMMPAAEETISLMSVNDNCPAYNLPQNTTNKDTVNPAPYIPEPLAFSTAKLNSLMLNGRKISGFSPDKFNYTYSLDESGVIPEITVEGNGYTVINHYENPAGGGKIAEIQVYDNTGLYNSYVIVFKPYVPEYYGNYVRLKTADVFASSEQDVEGSRNLATGSADSNKGTRWSANGIGEYLIHDLGNVTDIDAIGVSNWMGNKRSYKYDILVSTDGENYTKVIENKLSNGKSEDVEVTPLSNRVKARYIKYLGYGNTANEWNNVIELVTLKTK